MKTSLLIVSFTLCSLLCQAQSNFDVRKLNITWEVIENNHNSKMQFRSAFTFSNTGSRTLPSTGWTIFFNFVRAVHPESVTGNVMIDHVNGDLYKLTPRENFRPLAPKESLRIEFVSNDWVVNFTDAPAGLYLVWQKDESKGFPITGYKIKESVEPRQYLRFSDDKIGLITPEMLYEKNKSISVYDANSLMKIFPTPKKYQQGSGMFMITETTSIKADPGFEREADYLAEELYLITSKKLSRNSKKEEDRNKIVLRKSNMKEEAYTLSVTPSNIEITASSSVGIFYGIQSLKTLIDPNALKSVQRFIAIPAVEVADEPRFTHRAFFLDVARNFQPKSEVLKIIDLMSLYKLNVLHLHLNDDEGWRIEIPGLPELTAIGSRRGHTLSNEEHLQPSFGSGPHVTNPSGSGYYSRQEYLEILRYATARFVKVIPEIETPGHARAAVKAMNARYKSMMKDGKKTEAEKFLLYHPEDESTYKSVQGWNDNVMDVGLPSTYAFLEKVVSELIDMYKETGAPLTTIHFGGDEVPAGVWEKSPACRKIIETNARVQNTNDLWYYFFDKIDSLVKAKGLTLYGWEEIAMRKTSLDGSGHYIPNPDFANRNFQVDVWNNVLGWGAEDLAYKLANAGYKVVLSCVSHLYFDMAYHKAFDEPGYYWGGFIDVDKPFSFIPFDYFRNAHEDRLGGALDRKIFVGKERLTDYGKKNIVGIQGLIWAENMISTDRLEYQMLPKFFGLAERAWAEDPEWANETDSLKAAKLFNESWSQFTNVLGQRELIRLDYYHQGYRYRIPAPGAKVSEGRVMANIQFPGLIIRYTTDGKEPTGKSPVYDGPIDVKGTIKLRAFNALGRGGKISMVQNR